MAIQFSTRPNNNMSELQSLLNGSIANNRTLDPPEIHKVSDLAPFNDKPNLLDNSATQINLHRIKSYILIHDTERAGEVQTNMREKFCFEMDELDMGCNKILAAQQTGVRLPINQKSRHHTLRNADGINKNDLFVDNQQYSFTEVFVYLSWLC